MDSIDLKNLPPPLLPRGWQNITDDQIKEFERRRHQSDITPIRHPRSFPFVNKKHEVMWQSDPFCIGKWCFRLPRLPRLPSFRLPRLFSKKGGKNINKTKKYRKIKR